MWILDRILRLLRSSLPFTAVVVVWLAGALAAEAQVEPPAEYRAALLPWSLLPERPDVARASEEWLASGQAAVGGEPGIAWVERAELGRLLSEQELSAAGLGDPRHCLKLGKLSGAQLLITGRIDVRDPAASVVSLEAIDAVRGDLLAERSIALPKREHRLFKPGVETGAVVVEALRALVRDAASRLRMLAKRPSVALLFLANQGSSSRLDARAARMLDELGVRLEEQGMRLLRFPRSKEAGAEQELAVLGLVDSGDADWRGVADLNVWGTYLELARDGVAFEDTETEIQLRSWDGAGATKSSVWRGPVRRLPEAAAQFAKEFSAGLRGPKVTVERSTREQTASLLVARAGVLEKEWVRREAEVGASGSTAFKAFRAQQLGLLQTAVFFDPASAEARIALFDARWNPERLPIEKRSIPELWLGLEELASLSSLGRGYERVLKGRTREKLVPELVRLELLERLINRIAEEAVDGRRSIAELNRAADHWVRVVLDQRPRAFDTPDQARRRRAVLDAAVRQHCKVDNAYPSLAPEALGTAVLARMFDKTWDVLVPSLSAAIGQQSDDTDGYLQGLVFRVFEIEGRGDVGVRKLLSLAKDVREGTVPRSQEPPPVAKPTDEPSAAEPINLPMQFSPEKLAELPPEAREALVQHAQGASSAPGSRYPAGFQPPASIARVCTAVNQLKLPLVQTGHSTTVGARGDSVSLIYAAKPGTSDEVLNSYEERIREYVLEVVPGVAEVKVVVRVRTDWESLAQYNGTTDGRAPSLVFPTESVRRSLANPAASRMITEADLKKLESTIDLPVVRERFEQRESDGNLNLLLRYIADPGLADAEIDAYRVRLDAFLRANLPKGVTPKVEISKDPSFATLAAHGGLISGRKVALPASPTKAPVLFAPAAQAGPVPLTLCVGQPGLDQPSNGGERFTLVAPYGGGVNDTRVLACTAGYLFVDGHPLLGATDAERSEYRLVARAQITGDTVPLSNPLGATSRVVAATVANDSLYLATAFDGLVRMSGEGIEHLGPDQGAPSLKLDALAACRGGLVVAAAPPEVSIGKLDTSTGRWTTITTQDATLRLVRRGDPRPLRLAASGRWLLAVGSKAAVYDLEQGVWSASFAKATPGGVEPVWMTMPASAVLGDDRGFWVGGRYGLVAWDPSSEPAGARTVLSDAVIAMADAGANLLVLADPAVIAGPPPGYPGPPLGGNSAPGLLVIEKSSGRVVERWPMPRGLTHVVWGGDRAYVSGQGLYSVALPRSCSAQLAYGTAGLGGLLKSQELHQAVRFETVAALKARIPELKEAAKTAFGGRSLLHSAAEAGRAEVVSLLLDAGFAVDAFSPEGLTPLALAAGNSQLEVVRLLLARGAAVNASKRPARSYPYPPAKSGLEQPGPPPGVEAASAEARPDGTVRLRWKFKSGPFDLIRIYRRDPADTVPAYMGSLQAGRRGGVVPDLGRLLTELGPAATEFLDETPVLAGGVLRYRIVASGPTEREIDYEVPVSAEVMLPKDRAPARAVFSGGFGDLFQTALHRAASDGSAECVAALLDAGADGLALDYAGTTPLHRAVLRGHAENAQLLATRTGSLHCPLPPASSMRRSLLPALAGRAEADGVAGDGPWARRISDALDAAYLGAIDRASFEALLAEASRTAKASVARLAATAAGCGLESDVERFLALAGGDERARLAAVFEAQSTDHLDVAESILRKRPDSQKFTARCADLVAAILQHDLTREKPTLHPLLLPFADPLQGSALDNIVHWVAFLPEQATGAGPSVAERLRLLVEAGARLDTIDPSTERTVRSKIAAAPAGRAAEIKKPASAAPADTRAKHFTFGELRLPVGAIERTSIFWRSQPATLGGARINPSVSPEARAVLHAAETGDEAALVAGLARAVPIDLIDEEGCTPLLLAVKAGHRAMAHRLIDLGADINHVSNSGDGCLKLALLLKDLTLFQELLDLGANPNITHRAGVGNSAFARAVRRRQEALPMLIAAGANPNLPVNDGGWIPPLFYAAKFGDAEAVRTLERLGADGKAFVWVPADARTYARLTPLHMAARSKNLDIVKHFIELGHDPSQAGPDDCNALDEAERAQSPEIAAYLRNLGVRSTLHDRTKR